MTKKRVIRRLWIVLCVIALLVALLIWWPALVYPAYFPTYVPEYGRRLPTYRGAAYKSAGVDWDFEYETDVLAYLFGVGPVYALENDPEHLFLRNPGGLLVTPSWSVLCRADLTLPVIGETSFSYLRMQQSYSETPYTLTDDSIMTELAQHSLADEDNGVYDYWETEPRPQYACSIKCYYAGFEQIYRQVSLYRTAEGEYLADWRNFSRGPLSQETAEKLDLLLGMPSD